MAITPEVPGGIDVPVAKTAEAAGTVAIPASKTAEAVGVVAVPIAKTAEAAGTVAVPIAKTAEAAGTVAVPIAKTAESVGVVAVPIAKTAETAGAVAVPNTLTAVGAAAFPRTFTPTLNLDFKNGLYAQNGATKNQSDLITYSRNSSASYLDRFIDANGDWNYFLNTDYVGSVTNLLTYSEQFDNAAWTKTNATISTNNTKDPLNGLTADKIASDATATQSVSIRSSITSTAASNYTISAYVKKSEASFLQILFTTGHVASNPRVNFDLSTGVIGSQDADIDSASIIPVGNDWFRISVTVIAVGTLLNTFFAAIKSSGDTLGQTNAWTAGDGLFIWGAQINAGLKMLPYVKSIASATAETQTESLRIEYDAATGESLGALIETASTNLCLRSEVFGSASWTKALSSIANNSTNSPDNSTSADKYEAGATATNSPNLSQSVVSVASNSYTVSVFIKRSEASFIQLFFGGAQVANDPVVNFDLSSGVIGSQDADIDAASITPVGNDWFRISATVVAVGVELKLNINLIKSASDTRNQANAWTAGDGLYIWGAQIEAQEAPTSYIRTEGSTVSRLADLVSAPIAGNVPSSGAVTFYADISALYSYGLSRNIYNIDSLPFTKLAFYNSSNELGIRHGGLIEDYTAGLYKQGSLVMSYSGSGNLMSNYFNGSLLSTISAGVQSSNDITGIIGIGNNNALTTAQLNGHIKKLTIYDKALTALEVALL